MEPIKKTRKIDFHLLVSNPPGWLNPGLLIAASRCGAVGLLNCEGIQDIQELRRVLTRLSGSKRGTFGIQLEVHSTVTPALLSDLAQDLAYIVFTGTNGGSVDGQHLASLIQEAAQRCRQALDRDRPVFQGAGLFQLCIRLWGCALF